MKIILDTNVIIAAFATRGLCSATFELCLDRFDVILSEMILKETFNSLKSKIKMPATQCKTIISYLRENCEISGIDDIEKSACRDKSDLHVLGLAKRTSADIIITGDKDLLDLSHYKKCLIVTLREFWSIVKKKDLSN
jgi:putative PIN family toxin of toxin-antitoxin system